MLLPLALGLAATAVVIGLHAGGLLDRAELLALDFRFRHFATAPENTDIVHIDIDDGSLDELGRWPWPRELLAGVVNTLHECGAEAVALDVIMPEPQETRYVSPEHRAYTTYAGGTDETIPPVTVLDDLLLGRAIRSAGRVFVPMHIQLGEDQTPAMTRRLLVLLAGGDLPADEAAAALAAEGLLPKDLGPADAESFAKAYLAARSLVALRRFAVPPEDVAGFPAWAGTVVPPLATFSRSAHQTGFVTVEPDEDGAVRRVPLLAGRGEHVWAQFALALGAERLADGHGGGYRIQADPSVVRVKCSDGFVREIPVDGKGMMLINWVRPGGGDSHPRHIPAHYVGDVWRWKQQAASLALGGVVRRTWLVQLIVRARQFSPPVFDDICFDLEALLQRADDLRAERSKLELAGYKAYLFRPGWAGATDLAAQARWVSQQQDQVMIQVAELSGQLLALAQADAKQAWQDPLSRPVAEACRILLERIPADERAIGANIDKRLAAIRKSVSGKICLVGSTATGAADFVPTPVDGRTPGVVVHANIFNTILSGTFVRRADQTTDLLVILLAGLVVSLVAARLPVLQAGPIGLALAGGYAVVNVLVVFGTWNIWLAVVAPLAAMVGSFLMVTAYRQLTEERAKRRIRGLFAHALSPALVDRLIEDPSLARLGGERRVLSCFFSDLVGFTPISERLGEQRTVRLLNRYFDRMTDVIQQRHGGYLNKFLGDGIFVFFGAPVLQDDHAARAIQAALDCQDAVKELNADMAESFDADIELRCRVGISTGEAMVGNCGSTQRMDYTAIGDTVNLASRLESANKSFGTGILVSEASWQARGDYEILARPMGKLLVVGKTEPVAVWNVLCHQMDAADDDKWSCDQFARGVGLFAARNFAGAARAFEEVLELAGDDRAARMYLDLCVAYRAEPPGEAWDGAVQLAEK